MVTLNPQLRALQVQVTAEGYQPFVVRPRNNLGNFEIQDLRAPAVPNVQLAGGSPIDSTEVFSHWQGPLTATFRLLPLLNDESRLKRILGPIGFSESSVRIQPGTVIDFVNTDFRARSIISPRDPASGQATGARGGPMLLHDGEDHGAEAPLDSGLITPGESVAIRFDKPGVYTVVDGENGYSTLTVIVSVNAPPPDGVYRVFLPVLRR
jgi:plastocyanin